MEILLATRAMRVRVPRCKLKWEMSVTIGLLGIRAKTAEVSINSTAETIPLSLTTYRKEEILILRDLLIKTGLNVIPERS